MKKINIAIDGPASSANSGKNFSSALWVYVYTDTGAMYRSITYLALKTGCSLEDESGLVALIHTYPITFAPTETGQDVFVDGTKVTEEIRQPEVTNAVSKVSAYQSFRETGPTATKNC